MAAMFTNHPPTKGSPPRLSKCKYCSIACTGMQGSNSGRLSSRQQKLTWTACRSSPPTTSRSASIILPSSQHNQKEMARCAGILLVAVVLLGARASSAQGILGRIACIAKSPSPPTGLSADLKAEGSIALSWAAGGSGGGLLAAGPACVSGYSLTVYETGKPGTGKTFETKVKVKPV